MKELRKMKTLSRFSGVLGSLLMAGAGFAYAITKDLNLTTQIVGFVGLAMLLFFIYDQMDEILEALGSRSTRYSSLALVLTVLFGLVLGLVNFIAQRHPRRFDTTENKVHSLSPQSIQVVKGLTQPVQITTFFLMESGARTQFKDLYETYREHTDTLIVTYIEVEKDPVAVKQFAITQPDTVVISSGTNERRITEITEEKLTNALIAVTRTTQKRVCFLEGHGEHAIGSTEPDGLAEAKAALEKQSFVVTPVSLFKEGKVPEDCRVLVAVGPTRPLFEQERPLLEQWVSGGGRLIYLVDPGVDAAVTEVLKTWGITATDNLVVDPVAQSFFGNAAVPLGVAAGYNKIVESIRETPVFFPLARSLELANPAPGNGYFETLLRTASEDAWGETDPAIVRPEERGAVATPQNDETDTKGPLVLAALLNLPITGDAKPVPPDGETTTPDSGDSGDRKAVVVAFGDSDFATNDYFHRSANGDLFLNAISFLAEEEDLLAIRPREASKQTVSMTQAQGSFIFYMSLLIVPAVPLLLGIYTFFSRRSL